MTMFIVTQHKSILVSCCLALIVTIVAAVLAIFMVFIAPQAEWAGAQPAFDAVVNSLQFVK